MGRAKDLLDKFNEKENKSFGSKEEAQKYIDDNEMEGATIKEEDGKFMVMAKEKDSEEE